jgi:site-specific DNA-methyltransferase (adenine-specific)
MNRVHFSSESEEYATPNWLFDLLEDEVGGFDIDVCATAQNAKCKRFFTKAIDGLKQKWEGNIFGNFPYGQQVSVAKIIDANPASPDQLL